MSDHLSRQGFIKLAAIGSATAAALSGCGTAARYVQRQPYTDMPEYTLPGQSTFFATTCRECPASCGIVVRTVEGRAHKVDGNPHHPLSQGNTCSRAQAALQGLYNPDRLSGPMVQATRGSLGPINWDAGLEAVQTALAGGHFAFLLGQTPDHLFDLVSEICSTLGAPAPLRFGALGMFEGRATLVEACKRAYGQLALPYFDLGNAEMVFSFGANFAETWLAPVTYQRAYAELRQGHFNRRGYLVQFEPRMSLTAASADEWVPILPGSEALVALALGKLVAGLRGTPADAFAQADVAAAAQASGISEERLHHLAELFASANAKVALPGGLLVGQTNGLEAVQAVLALNAAAGSLGAVGGLFYTPLSTSPLSSFAEVQSLVERLKNGEIKTLFVHGFNPVFELPRALDFAAALEKVPTVISFASFQDETTAYARYLLPDHTPLEGWGYQLAVVGNDRTLVSANQPVVTPLYETRATADVLLAALAAGQLAPGLAYHDEVDFIQKKTAWMAEAGGTAAPLFWTQFLQQGGWWEKDAHLSTPQPAAETALPATRAEFAGDGDFYLLPFPHIHLGDGSLANRPWLQETPDPMTTVMWDSWIEINPKTAEQLGLKDNDVVRVTSPAGEIEVPVYCFPAIRPDTVAIPFGQGHTALGRYAQGRGVNPLDVIALQLNAAGDLAFAATRVKLTPTGKTHPLARFEDRVGVYGE